MSIAARRSGTRFMYATAGMVDASHAPNTHWSPAPARPRWYLGLCRNSDSSICTTMLRPPRVIGSANRCAEQISRRNRKCCCTLCLDRSSVSAAAFIGESWHHRYIRCRLFDSGTRLWLKKLPARTEWYERVPHLFSLQCYANMSVSCFRGISRVSLKHDGHAFRDASRPLLSYYACDVKA